MGRTRWTRGRRVARAAALAAVLGAHVVPGTVATAATQPGPGAALLRGQAYGGEARLTHPDLPTVTVGKIATQSMPCLPLSGKTYTNQVALARALPPSGLGLPDPILETGKIINAGVALFDADSSTVTERSSVERLSLLDNLIQASAVSARSTTTSDGGGYVHDGATEIVGLTIDGENHSASPPPNTEIELPNDMGKVVLNEQRMESGKFIVTAIHVILNDPASGYSGDIRIAVAMTKITDAVARLFAYAYQLSGRSGKSSDPAGDIVSIGRQNILALPCEGTKGKELVQIGAGVDIAGPPEWDPVARLHNLESRVQGNRLAGASYARATSHVESTELLGGLVRGTAVSSFAETEEVADGVESEGGGSFVSIDVDDQHFEGPVPPNTSIDLGFAKVVLNRQTCSEDGVNYQPVRSCKGSDESTIIVTQIFVLITTPDNPFGLPVRSEIHVSEAASGLNR